jgi:hypothetical protein
MEFAGGWVGVGSAMEGFDEMSCSRDLSGVLLGVRIVNGIVRGPFN